MSWSRLKASGSGDIELRLMVEGWPYEFCTAASMIKTLSDGRQRIDGLLRDGIVIKESVDMAAAEVDASSFTASIVDHQGTDAVTTALYTLPDDETFLAADLTKSATTVTVLSTALFPSSGVVHIGTEAIAYSGTTSTTFTGCTRGYWNTIAQAHPYLGADAEELVRAEVTNWPRTIEGRRCYLYAYGRGDDPQGDGTLIWRGIAVTSPRLDDTHSVWSFDVDPITAILKTEVGTADLGEAGIRGAYYPNAYPLRVYIAEYELETQPSPISGLEAEGYLTGFFETQEEFVEALTAKLSTLFASKSFTSVAAPVAFTDGAGSYAIRLVSPITATPKRILTVSCSRLDYAGNEVERCGGDPTSRLIPDGGFSGPDIAASSQASGVSYRTFPAEGGAMPRTSMGFRDAGVAAHIAGVTDRTTGAHEGLVYLSGGFAITTQLTGGTWEAPDTWTPDGVTSDAIAFDVINRDTAARTILLNSQLIKGAWAGSDSPKIKLLQKLTQAAYGSVADVRSHLVNNSPDLANLGVMPLITTEDTANWTAAVREASGSNPTGTLSGRAYLHRRRYVLSKPVKLDELMAEECKLLGVFPALDANGKITLRQMRVPTETETPVAAIDADTILVDNGLPVIELGARRGYIGSMSLQLGYDPIEDEHKGEVFNARSIRTLSTRRRAKAVECKPFSASDADSILTPADVVFVANKLIAMYGSEYAVVEVEVPFSLFDVRVGDVVSLVHPTLPRPGGRGISTNGIVIEREWQFDDARGRFAVMVHYSDVAGYAPSARITDATGSGTDWTLTVSELYPLLSEPMFVTGDDIDDHFEVGDEIVLREWDAASPTERTGAIVSVTAPDTVEVSLDASWTGLSGAVYTLEYAVAGSADVSQRAYAYIASSTGNIAFSVSRKARRFG